MLYNPFTIQTAHAATKIQDAGAILNQAAGPTGVQQVPLLDMVAAVMQALLGMVGIVFFILIVYGAYLWFAAAGADEKTKKGRGVIITAISGLMIVLAAGALSGFVFEKLTVGNITSPSVADLSTPWGGPVGGVQGPKPGEVTGCCIDRVGEYNFARRVTSEADCISNQGKNDAYSIDLAGEQKTGDAASGVRGEDWDFYAGKNAKECDQVFTCWDRKLGLFWGGSSDEEFQSCLSNYGLDKESLSQVWCLEVNPKPTPTVCSKMGAKACADKNGVNYSEDEELCKKNEADQNGTMVWCFNKEDFTCTESTVDNCESEFVPGEIVLAGKEACEKKMVGEVWCFDGAAKTCSLMEKGKCLAPLQNFGAGFDGKGECLHAGGKEIQNTASSTKKYCLVKESAGTYSCVFCEIFGSDGEFSDIYLNSENFDDLAACQSTRDWKESQDQSGPEIGVSSFCYDAGLGGLCLKCVCEEGAMDNCPDKNLKFVSESECESYRSVASGAVGDVGAEEFCPNNCVFVSEACRGSVGIYNSLCLLKCEGVNTGSGKKCYAKGTMSSVNWDNYCPQNCKPPAVSGENLSCVNKTGNITTFCYDNCKTKLSGTTMGCVKK